VTSAKSGRVGDAADGDPGDDGRHGANVAPSQGEQGHGAGDDDAAKDAADGKPHRHRRKQLPLWQEVIVLLALALALAIVVKAFFLQAFFVPSVSMEPTFLTQDRILVEKWSYWTGDVQRGDVVVFDDPGGWLGPSQSKQPSNIVQKTLEAFGLYPTGGHLVKRVIGVGGDEVACCDAKDRITVNGVPLEERDYLMRGVRPSEQDFKVQVPEGMLWVMGDNRPQSGDSRLHQGSPGGGYVPVDDVVGKVWAIVWPAGRMGLLHRPATFDNPALDG
jgi:signal peptidase I